MRRTILTPFGIVLALALVAVSLSHGLEGPRRAAYTLARTVERHRATRTLPSETVRGPSVTLHYDAADAALAPVILAELERLREPVADLLGLPAPADVTAVLHPTREDLAAVFGWHDGERAHGVYAAGIVRLLSPQVWLGPVEERADGALAETYIDVIRQYGPTAHELAHLILDLHTAGNYPAWLSEGLAQWVEFQLGNARQPGPEDRWHNLPAPYTFDELTHEFDLLPDQAQAYLQSYLAVAYLEEMGGPDGVRALVADLARGQSLDATLQSRFGVTVTGLQESLLSGEKPTRGGADSESD